MPTNSAFNVETLLANVKINARQKANLFISSRMSYDFAGTTLSEFRRTLKDILQAVYPFLNVELAEHWTGRVGSPRTASHDGGRDADIVIVILVDSAGHIDKSGLSATELEINAALEHSWDKVQVFVQDPLLDILDEQPKSYASLIRLLVNYEDGKLISRFSTAEKLITDIIAAIATHCGAALTRYPGRVSGKSTLHRTWELMTFTERHQEMKSTCANVFRNLSRVNCVQKIDLYKQHEDIDLYSITFVLQNTKKKAKTSKIPLVVSACPDRFSFSEASRFVGYPFRTATDNWASMVKRWPEKPGPIHIILIYKNITDTQIRRHLGNPDIRVAREPWGFYARDPERFIQSLYLVDCKNPTTLRERLHESLAWLTNDQLSQVINRANGRGAILQARQAAENN